MVKNHLKTLAAPKTWAIKRKSKVFIIRPAPGAHKIHDSLPLKILLVDMLKYGRTSKEIKYILNTKNIMIDGKRRKSLKFNVGFMDSIQVPELNEYYRIVFNEKGKIDFVAIPKEESDKKICKIANKTGVKKKTQINFDDGKNILVDKDTYKVGDSLLLHLPDLKIVDHFKLEKGAQVYIMRGKHTGTIGSVEDIKASNIYVKSDGDIIQTLKKHALVIGKDKPVITVKI